MLTADRIVDLLELQPLPVEGGMFRLTYVASDTYRDPARYPSSKSICTAIYYLLTDEPDSFSALHQLPTDEIWHFYLGDPVEMLLLHPTGSTETPTLGHDLEGGEQPQVVVPAGAWQGARLAAGGRFALMGTTMAPGYDDLDYQEGDAKELALIYPDRATLIRQLSR